MSRYGPGTFTDGHQHPSAASGVEAEGQPGASADGSRSGAGASCSGRVASFDAAHVFGQAPWMAPHSGAPVPAPPPQAGPGGTGAAAGLGAFGLDPVGGAATGLPTGFGTWNELIAGGVVDRSYIEQEAERRKQEIDRAMENQIVQLENQCQEQRTQIQQQAEYHAQMAERQIESHKKQHQAHVTRQAEIQAYSILQRAEMEKGRLGQEAARALSQQSEREKAVVLHDAMRQAEDVWRASQRALLEQAQKKKAEIDVQAKKRTEEIEAAVRQAVGRIYISPTSPMAPLGGSSFASYIPTPTADA